MIPRHKVSKCYYKNGANRLAQYRAATNFQFVRLNKTQCLQSTTKQTEIKWGMPIISSYISEELTELTYFRKGSESVKFLSRQKVFTMLPPPLSHTERTFSLSINSLHVAAHYVFDHSSITWYFVQLAWKTTLYIYGNSAEHSIMTNQMRRGSET